MKYRCLVLFGVLAAVIALASASLAGQAPRPADRTVAPTKPWTPARTAWGDPDLQGIWQGRQQVPFERLTALAGREFLTDAEVAAVERAVEESRARNVAGDAEDRGYRDFPLYNSVWGGQGPGAQPSRISRRTSAIIDPLYGKVPPWTPQQLKRWEAREAATRGRGESDWVTDRPVDERCIKVVTAAWVDNWGLSGDRKGEVSGFASRTAFPGPVRRILQAPGYVAITMEENDNGGREAGAYRIIPLDGRPHLGAKFKHWMGNARGHWDGNTLVVEITNITYGDPNRVITTYGLKTYPGSGETLKVTERYTRVDANTLEYRDTIEDPEVYTRPYTVRHELSRDDQFKISPQLCHENNKNMGMILAQARADEKSALQYAEDAARLRQQRLEELKAEWAALNKSR